MYDVRNEVCCRKNKLPLIEGRTECYGAMAYNPRNEKICGGQLQPIGMYTCVLQAVRDGSGCISEVEAEESINCSGCLPFHEKYQEGR